ncbi:MAG: hypothetical protein HQL97_04560 [Magnetococcales bacterium]|nr:hypothetical protein [Magnetococcales bacterium]
MTIRQLPARLRMTDFRWSDDQYARIGLAAALSCSGVDVSTRLEIAGGVIETSAHLLTALTTALVGQIGMMGATSARIAAITQGGQISMTGTTNTRIAATSGGMIAASAHLLTALTTALVGQIGMTGTTSARIAAIAQGGQIDISGATRARIAAPVQGYLIIQAQTDGDLAAGSVPGRSLLGDGLFG